MTGGPVEASGDRSVAAGGNIRQVATGDFATLAEHATMLPPEAFALEPCTFPVRNVPDRSAQFVGRGPELAMLDEAFGEPGGVVVHAVHGLGGIGKSTLAAHWAIGRAADFNPVWWITAESRTGVDAGLAALGRALQPALVDVLSEDAFRERTLQWLAANDGWLLVLDNVSDPADIRHLLARAPGGRSLITTRRGATSWRGIAEPLDLDVLEPAEAVELFTKVCPGQSGGVEELCRELGYLPLAVDQAAAYCREAGISPSKYLTLLASYPADMYAATAEGGDAERTVARVWSVTLDRLADTPTAMSVLLVTAWWASDGIPRAYLDSFGSPPKVTEAIRRLAAHSMITLHEDTISVHRLVQAVARTPDRDGLVRSRKLVETGHGIAVSVLAGVQHAATEAGVAEATSLDGVTHIEALASRSAPEADTEDAAELFGLAGMKCAMAGYGARAVTLLERAVDAGLRVCGPDHETTLTFRAWLADNYRTVGESARALTLITQVLADSERVLGPDHPQTFDVRGTAAGMLAESGDRERGLTLARENAEVAARVLGEGHPETHNARLVLDNIQLMSGAEGGGEERVRAVEGRLARAIADLGEEDPTVGSLRVELANAWWQAGDFVEAVRAIEEADAAHRRTFGDTHIVTLYTGVMHSVILRRAGDPARADALAAQVTADIERSYGDSPQALQLLHALALDAAADSD